MRANVHILRLMQLLRLAKPLYHFFRLARDPVVRFAELRVAQVGAAPGQGQGDQG